MTDITQERGYQVFLGCAALNSKGEHCGSIAHITIEQLEAGVTYTFCTVHERMGERRRLNPEALEVGT